MTQHVYEAPGWAVDEKSLLAGITGDSIGREHTSHTVAKAKSILTGEKTWITLVTLSLTCGLHTLI